MRLALFAILLAACAPPDDVAEESQALFGSGRYWPIGVMGITEVPVCWLFDGYDAQKASVRSAVEGTWGLHTTLSFTGWGRCDTYTPQRAIRIDITTGSPYSIYGPTTTSPAMYLNFTYTGLYNPWFWLGSLWTSCRDFGKDQCIVSNARHEFGHALGFFHEQDRPDYDPSCSLERVNGSGDLLTTFDRSSIMSYCRSFPGGSLSIRDLEGVQEVYGVYRAPVAVVRNVDGRLNVFARDTGNNLWWMSQTSANGAWSAWQSLGAGAGGVPGVGRNVDGRLELFLRTSDGQLARKSQTSPGVWGPTNLLGGDIVGTPVVAANADGRLEMFARRKDHAIWHIWQTTVGGSWSGWASFGGWMTSDPAVGQWSDGRLEVFARADDGTIWHAPQVVPNGSWYGWSVLPGQWNSAPSVVRDPFGRLAVFARATDRTVQVMLQLSANNFGYNWPLSIGGLAASVPVAGVNQDGRLEVFALHPNGAVYHAWQTSPGGAYTGWYSLGGWETSGVAVANDADGRLEVFARGTNGGVWRDGQSTPNGGWPWWVDHGRSLANSLAALAPGGM